MSLTRRDVATALLTCWSAERAFANVVRWAIETKRLKRKDGERIILAYYQRPDWLNLQLENSAMR